MIKQLVAFYFLGTSLMGLAQSYHDAPGAAGSIAFSKDSSCFVAWATNGIISRGYLDINDTLVTDSGSNRASFGVLENALGPAEGDGMTVVSLGDAGTITLTFNQPITNGPGYDFAIFENSFIDHYMEFAFVEVSSNGTDFVRFPNDSEIPFISQFGNASLADCRMVNNLAGKYRAGFGTPFDLSEVQGVNDSVDVTNITHIRLIDVIGSIDGSHVSYDSDNQPINDPYPTPYPSCGFDLDAVGVINQFVGIEENELVSWYVYPNPSMGTVSFSKNLIGKEIRIMNHFGQTVFSKELEHNEINLEELSSGIYLIQCEGFTKTLVIQN